MKLRKLTQRETVLVSLIAVGLPFVAYRWLSLGEPARPAQRATRAEALVPVPRIDLARLDAPRDVREAGRRNLFTYGELPVAAQPDPPMVVATPPPRPAPTAHAGFDGAPPLPSLPPLNVKYVGSVENARGLKVAVLVTDRREVLTGQAGQVVANRYRIARIGLESVDLEDVNTGQSRRVPLRGE